MIDWDYREILQNWNKNIFDLLWVKYIYFHQSVMSYVKYRIWSPPSLWARSNFYQGKRRLSCRIIFREFMRKANNFHAISVIIKPKTNKFLCSLTFLSSYNKLFILDNLGSWNLPQTINRLTWLRYKPN